MSAMFANLHTIISGMICGIIFLQTAVIDFERVIMLRNQGVAGVSHPWKDFRKNNQSFEVYNKKTKT